MNAAGLRAEIPDPPPEAQAMFGARLEMARDYAALLAGAGMVRGLLGPRETPRLWDRHLLNGAALADLLPADVRVVDVGSGAGLPGLALAVRRPDLHVDLVEPLLRRVDFLQEVVAELGLDGTVRVVRGRADEPAIRAAVGEAEWVTARAVAPLGRLAGWTAPLLRPGGRLLAIKGAGAQDELVAHLATLRAAGFTETSVVGCGSPPLTQPVTVVLCRRDSSKGGKRVGRPHQTAR